MLSEYLDKLKVLAAKVWQFCLVRWRMLSGLAGAFVFGALIAALAFQLNLPGRLKNKVMSLLPEEKLEDTQTFTWNTMETGVLTIETTEIPLGEVDGGGRGGGLAEFDDKIVFSTAWGQIGFVDFAGGKVTYTGAKLPMNMDGMTKSEAWGNILFNRNWFRVHDLAIMDDAQGQPTLFVSHHLYRDGDICTVVSQAAISTTDNGDVTLGDWTQTYQIDPCVNLEEVAFNYDGHMSGGRLLPDGDGKLLMTVGDFGFGGLKGREDLVRPGSPTDFAKLLRIDVATSQAEIVAEGFRNAQGLARDDKGRIWSTEHGAQGGDEVNLVKPGLDYGWPLVSLGFEYAVYGTPRSPIRGNPVQGRHDGFEQPVYAFMPSTGTSNLIAVPSDAEAFDLWAGDLLVSTLRAQTVFRLRLDGERVVYSEPIELGRRIRDIIQLSDGRIVMLTDQRSLLVLRDPKVHGEDTISLVGYEQIAKASAVPQYASMTPESGREIFKMKCGSCHSIDGSPGVGPTLKGVIGREIGALPGFSYSRGLAAEDGKWTTSKFAAFARNPATAGYPDSSMPPVPALGPRVMDLLVDYINEGKP